MHKRGKPATTRHLTLNENVGTQDAEFGMDGGYTVLLLAIPINPNSPDPNNHIADGMGVGMGELVATSSYVVFSAVKRE